MRFLALSIFYFLVMLGQSGLTGNHLSDIHHSIENATDQKIELSSLSHENSSSIPSSTETAHHECPVCHGHALAIHTSTATFFHTAISSNDQLKHFYQNLYYSMSLSSIFRPPIA